MESSRVENEIFCHDPNNDVLSIFIDKKEEIIVEQLPLYIMMDESSDIFYYLKSPQELYTKIIQKISEMKAVILEENSTKLEICASFQPIIQTNLSAIEIAFYVYSYIIYVDNDVELSNNDELYNDVELSKDFKMSVVYFQRKTGDIFEYSKILYLFRKMFAPSPLINEIK